MGRNIRNGSLNISAPSIAAFRGVMPATPLSMQLKSNTDQEYFAYIFGNAGNMPSRWPSRLHTCRGFIYLDVTINSIIFSYYIFDISWISIDIIIFLSIIWWMAFVLLIFAFNRLQYVADSNSLWSKPKVLRSPAKHRYSKSRILLFRYYPVRWIWRQWFMD